MSSAISSQPHTNGSEENYLNTSYGIRSWLLTLDHKRIGILYLVTLSLFFIVGGIFASMIRIELMTPQADLVEAETYNKLFTMHGVVMIFFFLLPSVPAVLGNLVLPIMIGAKDVAFPRLNLLCWYCLIFGGGLATLAILMGGIDTGWTFYTPYSSTYSNSYVALALTGVFINGFSSILTGVNLKSESSILLWVAIPFFSSTSSGFTPILPYTL